ncbi:restriction endonuclease subunit S [Peribacillus frigoritolerans]|uniref:restriction endonuclease subunit S n=1 Tax=Peribacillus frigoritolerans TaxID=450367 RepID=UPI0034E0B75D
MSENEKLVPKRRFKEFKNADAWEQRKLGELGSVAMNKRIFKEQTAVTGEVPFFKIGTFGGDPDAFISRELFEEYKAKYPYPEVGDILISASGSIGRTVEYSGEDEYFQDSNIVWLKHDERLDKSFLKQFYSIVKWQGLEGSTIKRLYNKNILDTRINVPSLAEQQKIGQFFNDLNHLITLHQRKLNKTKAMKSAYLSEMFPAAEERKPKRRFAGFTDAWEQRTIGEFGYFYYGKSAPKWSVTSDATTPCVRYGELYTKHKEKIDTIYSFTNIPKENLKFSTGKEVLVPRVGEDPLDFANCSWLSIPGVAIGEMISVYNTKQNPLFTAYMFNTLLKYEFAKRVEGGNVSNLYYTYLENIPVSYPSLEEQDKIASFFDNLSTLIAFQQRKLEKLQNIKKAYLNEMFI